MLNHNPKLAHLLLGVALLDCTKLMMLMLPLSYLPINITKSKNDKIRTCKKYNSKKIEEQEKVKKKKAVNFVHLERAAADLVSNPTINVSIGTKMPPPPTPPTVPKADPKNPIKLATAILHPNSNF